MGIELNRQNEYIGRCIMNVDVNINIEIKEQEFTSEENDKCVNFYSEIVRQHKNCNGSGIRLGIGYEAVFCNCELVYKYVRSLLYARIPAAYWGLAIATLDSIFIEPVKSFINELSSVSGFLKSAPNMGKTAGLSLLGKKAILEGCSVTYCKAIEFIDLQKKNDSYTIHESSDILFGRLQSSELVLIDDIDRLDRLTNSDILIRYIRERLDNGLGVFLSTTKQEDELSTNIKEIITKLEFVIGVKFNTSLFKKLKHFNQEPMIGEATIVANI